MSQTALKILVTGGAGYIGSHLVHALAERNISVVVFDNLASGFREAIPARVPFIQGDICETEKLTTTLREHSINFVFHFAGVLSVPGSFEDPESYLRINFAGTRSVLKACQLAGIKNIIFSSSCTIYGNQEVAVCSESFDVRPMSPYGKSKKDCEDLLKHYAEERPDFSYLIFRYFNVAGASLSGRVGQRSDPATQLVHIASQAVTGRRSQIAIFGIDYETTDGTCVRDYVHVEDVVQALYLGMEFLKQGGRSQTLNCGSGVGHSVAEVLKVVKNLSRSPFEIIKKDRRPGDPDYLVSDNRKIQKVLNWKPVHSDLKTIIQSAIEWEAKLPT